jgi:hypothetical protein
MIDNNVTEFQAALVGTVSKYFAERRHSSIIWGAFVAMPLTIGIAGALDLIKLPLSAIEELGRGILLIPGACVDSNLSKKCITHLKNSGKYLLAIVSKIFLGIFADLICMYETFKNPLRIPFFAPASYFGSGASYNRSLLSDFEKKHPSICKNTL